jgi:hypothetical protein
MFYETVRDDDRLPYNPLKACVVPRLWAGLPSQRECQPTLPRQHHVQLPGIDAVVLPPLSLPKNVQLPRPSAMSGEARR